MSCHNADGDVCPAPSDGALMEYEICHLCHGDGGWHDCGEDCCCCADPDDDLNEQCQECNGMGHYRVCPRAGQPGHGEEVEEVNRRPLPKAPREPPTVTAMPETLDDFCEVVLTVNGAILGTWVADPAMTHSEQALMMDQIAETVRRKC